MMARKIGLPCPNNCRPTSSLERQRSPWPTTTNTPIVSGMARAITTLAKIAMRLLRKSSRSARPLRILDFGCGPGRDLKFFRDLGHEAIGLEGAARFVDLARAYSGCEVWLQDFLKLDLPAEFFDGIFANASLFHVPSQELPRVLRELWATFKTRRRALQLQSARRQPGRLERRALRLLLRLAALARARHRRRIRRDQPLLPPARPAARPTTLARLALAQTDSNLAISSRARICISTHASRLPPHAYPAN